MANTPPIPRVRTDARAAIEDEVYKLRHKPGGCPEWAIRLYLEGVRLGGRLMNPKAPKGDPDGRQ